MMRSILLSLLFTIQSFGQVQEPLSFQSLSNFIRANNIQSIEALLPLLPESYRRHYVLVYNSRSRQDASMDHPRVISFGSDARFILTFNGEPGARGLNDLEIMEWSDTDGFQMREIRFPSVGASGSHGSSHRGVTFDSNPTSCRECHGAVSRPLWNSYPFWPGVYGSADSRMPLESRELQGYLHYSNQVQPTHPRYRALIPLEVNSLQRNAQGQLEINPHSGYDYAQIFGRNSGEGPADLSGHFTTLNARRLWRAYNTNSHREALSPLLTAWAGRCFGTYQESAPQVPFESFFPNASAVQQQITTFGRYLQNVERSNYINRIAAIRPVLNHSRGSVRYEDPGQIYGSSQEPSIDDRYSSYLAFALSQIGMNFADYALAVGPNSFSVSGGGAEFLHAMMLLFQNGDGSLSTQAAYDFRFNENILSRDRCAALAAQSRTALGNTTIAYPCLGIEEGNHRSPLRNLEELFAATDRILISPPAMQRCSTCHEGPHPTGPRIPFSDNESLSILLHQSGSTLRQRILNRIRSTGTNRMPPSGEITDSDRNQIREYLRNL